MSENPNDLRPKVHPASREVLPEDPMNLHATEVPGDPDLMLRLLVEEYARLGAGTEDLLRLARDPFYTAFHGLLLRYGEEELERRIRHTLERCGVVRVRKVSPERLVQVDPAAPKPPTAGGRDDHHA